MSPVFWVAFAGFAVFPARPLWRSSTCTQKKAPVFNHTYQFNRAEAKNEPSFVSDEFELTGGTATVEVKKLRCR